MLRMSRYNKIGYFDMFFAHLFLKIIKINVIILLMMLSGFGFLTLFPKFRGVIRNAVYEALIEIGTPILSAHLTDIDIPDQTGNISSFLGTFYYGVTNISLMKIKIEHSYSSVDKDGVTLYFCNATIMGHINWYYKLTSPTIANMTTSHAKGEAYAEMSQIRLKSGIKLSSVNNTLILTYHHCLFEIDKIDLKFTKSILSPVLNAFRHELAEIVKDLLNNQTCKHIKKVVTKQTNSILAKIADGTGIADAVKLISELFSDTEVGQPPVSCQLPHRHSNARSHVGCKMPSALVTDVNVCKEGEVGPGCSNQKISSHVYF